MEKNVANFVKKCLHCQDSKAGKMVPRPMGEVVHGESIGEAVHFSFLYLGAGGLLGTESVEKQGYQYLMVIMDDLGSFVWIEEATTCTAEVAARTLLRWCSVIKVSRVWVSDTANYFKNRALPLVVEHPGADHHFPVANTAWTNGTVEKMILKIVKTFRAVASAARISLKDWARIVPMVQAAFNAGYRERLKASPFNLMFGRKPYSIFSALVAPGNGEWQVDIFDPDSVQVIVSDLMDAQERRREEVLELVRKNRARMRSVKRKGVLPDFKVGG